MSNLENIFDNTFLKSIVVPFDTVSLDEWAQVLIKIAEEYKPQKISEETYDKFQ